MNAIRRKSVTTTRENILRETINNLLEADNDDEEDEVDVVPEKPQKIDPKDVVEKEKASIDKQVFKLIFAALSEASNSKLEQKKIDWKILSRRLFEADDEPLIDTSTSTTASTTKKTLEDIDIGSYTAAVVRLITNFESLIDVSDTLVEMSRMKLSELYDGSTVKAFTELLSEEYDIEVGASLWDKEIENQPPPARGAGPSGT